MIKVIAGFIRELVSASSDELKFTSHRFDFRKIVLACVIICLCITNVSLGSKLLSVLIYTVKQEEALSACQLDLQSKNKGVSPSDRREEDFPNLY